MRKLLLASLLVSSGILASDTELNGRWDITVKGEARNRAWWLEVEGAGTEHPKGKFVGAPGGQMDVIPGLTIRDGELRFSFERRYHRDGPLERGLYQARLAGDELHGTFELGSQKLEWLGKRAPVINDKDDGSWKPAKPVALFNGKDLSGWHAVVRGQKLGWSVKEGALSSTGSANNLASDQNFWNFLLHVEYRVGPHSNSGIGLRGRYEVQILEDYGQPLSAHSNGAIYSRIVPAIAASKPGGEWQTFDIRLIGRDVTVVLNDKKIIDRKEIEGLTAIAIDPNESEPGPLVLQGDHGPVDFRSIVVTPLTK